LSSDRPSSQTEQKRQLLGRVLLWLVIALFVAGEWMIIFRPDLGTSFNFLRQPPRNVQCSEWSQAETELRFFNLKVWAIVSLSQAVVWGAVFFIAVRWLAGLAMTGASEGRWARVLKVAVRFLAFTFGLWFFLTPTHSWDLRCFSAHVTAHNSGALGYLAVGAAVLVMWVLENRVAALDAETHLGAVRQYLELRQKLQTLLAMASFVLAFGVIGLITRKTFVELISRQDLYPQSVMLEGFEYTILLGLAYAPVHASFNAAGVRIRNALVPLPVKGDVKGLQEWSRLSNDLSDLLQISLYDWKTFGPGIPILAPFLLGLLSTLFKSG